MTQRKKHAEDFKKDAVRMMLARGQRTVKEVAEGLGLRPNQLYRWHQKYSAELGGTLRTVQAQQQSDELRRRVRQLE